MMKENMNNKEKWATVTLRIHSKKITVQEITAFLEAQPTRTFEKGQLMSPRNPQSVSFEENLWLLEIEEGATLEEQLQKITDFIEQKLPRFQQLETSCEVDIFCGYFLENEQGGFVIESQIIKKLAVLPVNIIFDIYR
jgi:hypothetical protein